MPGTDILSPAENAQLIAILESSTPQTALNIIQALQRNASTQSQANNAALQYENEVISSMKNMTPQQQAAIVQQVIDNINSELYYVTPNEYENFMAGFQPNANIVSETENPSIRKPYVTAASQASPAQAQAGGSTAMLAGISGSAAMAGAAPAMAGVGLQNAGLQTQTAATPPVQIQPASGQVAVGKESLLDYEVGNRQAVS
jgi:hypothetical protein